ncbi:DNA cytosine methyltransferase [Sinorhizobium mexicanum]|uniref:Cytosine-specific methyltransferase n=1 Tax=Sinorhizobium mexicanum TaxID=375549 RepID=A0A859QP54_9HYPH|nr:DNA (cytosine-5-)-methyltransferase [Sinorhizobium mexicanum]MBP1884882.1 DNA (cytosine-5)-methyltransferase 1 [Sinorhizobium mexicanum]QLL64530.1 DNA (cytosine-5-)-methyltransferase [Sinorhizobium mexicanum]
MKIAGLFAGVGGLESGLAAAGHETSMLCEIWEPARAVLASRIPDVPCERDVRDIKALPGEVEVLVAGFPCQDLSQAGLTAGIEGARSGLVGQVFRLLDQRRVPWVVLENVSFMLQLDRGRAMRILIEAFEERGYRWAYRVVNSLSFLPQRRERVLFVATTTDVDPASVVLADEAEPQLAATDLDARAHGFYWTEGVRGLGWAPDAIPTLKNGSTVGIASPPAILLPTGGVITPDIRDAERFQGFPEDWTKPAEQVGRPSLRWSLVGNAVSVPVAKWLGGCLASPSLYDVHRDGKLPPDGRWPKAARFDGERRYSVSINAYPQWEARPALVKFLQYYGKPLSARATRGFLSRTERATLRFADGFQDRLRGHLARMEAFESQKESGCAVAAE